MFKIFKGYHSSARVNGCMTVGEMYWVNPAGFLSDDDGNLRDEVHFVMVNANHTKSPTPPKQEKADRFNEGKPQLSYMLDAPNAMTGLARVFEAGAKKYSRDNWKKGLDQNELVDCLMRHLLKVQNGKLIDDGEGGTGCNHWNLVLWNALVLAEQFNGEGDDGKE